MSDITSILILSDIKTEEKSISAEISQESSLSFILYLFYTAELLETCNKDNEKLSASTFINDTTLLIYE